MHQHVCAKGNPVLPVRCLPVDGAISFDDRLHCMKGTVARWFLQPGGACLITHGSIAVQKSGADVMEPGIERMLSLRSDEGKIRTLLRRTPRENAIVHCVGSSDEEYSLLFAVCCRTL
jgi:hypothetical protein